MLDISFKHEAKLKKAYTAHITSERCKYFSVAGWTSYDIDIVKDDWSTIQKVSIKNDEVIGFFSAQREPITNIISSVQIISFAKNDDEKYEFSKDLKIFFRYLIKNFKKIKFAVVVGNKIEKNYDRFIELLGGRIIGISINDGILQDGALVNLKYYEILNKKNIDYEKNKNKTDI